MSSMPVREALRELVAMGVLDSAPHRGVWVREVTLSETIEAFEVRAALETLAAQKAAERLRGRCRPLKHIADEILSAAKRHDYGGYQRHNQAFHRAIVEASGNGVLLKVWDSLAFEIRTRATLEFLTDGAVVDVAREHFPSRE